MNRFMVRLRANGSPERTGKICGYVKVPVNTTAEIHLPEKEAGAHRSESGADEYERRDGNKSGI